MAAYRFAYLSLLVVAAVFSQAYAGPMSSVIFITILLLPAVSFILALIGRLAFNISFDTAPVTIEKGDRLKLQVAVKNRFIVPCSCIYITATVPKANNNNEARLIFSLGALQKRLLNLTYDPEFRGEYEFTLDRAYFFDVFKIFKFKKDLKLKKEILVTPKIYDISCGEGLSFDTEEESTVQSFEHTGGERSFVRKYKDGDEIKRIHWKLSSKQDDYMVWQTVKNRASSVYIVCDLTKPLLDDRQSSLLTDCILEAAFALSLYNLKRDRQSVLSYYDCEKSISQSLLISDLNHIYKASEEAARVKSYQIGRSFAEEAKKPFFNSDSESVIILITHKADNELAKLAEELSLIRNFNLLVIGKAEEEADRYIKNLKNINYVTADTNDFQNELSKAISKIYGA